ncbi:hypothetical protein OEZ86_004601 [Tetradesmus obliquus]|nr:hypothetical protein OEZ86_004601 [Tetradesmus obliquus]
MGFDFGDEERDSRLAAEPRRPSPKAFAAYTLRCSSLLLYAHVFKGAVGEALLALIASSQKYQASNKDIIAAYAKFYGLLLLSGYECFSDYVVDQILLGRDNSFARAVAQGQVQDGAPILQAVAYDLDTLQGLAISLETLADYVGEVAPTAGSYWVSAASATAVRRRSSGKQLPTAGAPPQPAVVIPASDGGPLAGTPAGSFVGRPASQEELASWRGVLAGHDAWSSAVPLLREYYSRHGFGITSRNSALRWSKGGFEEATEGGLAPNYVPGVTDAQGGASFLSATNPAALLAPPMAAAAGSMSSAVLSALRSPYDALAENTARHCAGLPAHHAVVCGPPGAGKSWLLWEGTLLAGKEAGLRIVEVPPSELPNILDIARGCARYPRVHFILVADHVDSPLKGQLAADLMSGLGSSGASGWPSNTLLYVGASASSTVSRSDPVVARCPLVVPLQGLQDEEAFLQAVEELLAAKQSSSSSSSSSSSGGSSSSSGVLSGELKEAALAWGKQQGLSVRSAAVFARSCM